MTGAVEIKSIGAFANSILGPHSFGAKLNTLHLDFDQVKTGHTRQALAPFDACMTRIVTEILAFARA
jgi:hypothetical protein